MSTHGYGKNAGSYLDYKNFLMLLFRMLREEGLFTLPY